jgi:hypothetical protein
MVKARITIPLPLLLVLLIELWVALNVNFQVWLCICCYGKYGVCV